MTDNKELPKWVKESQEHLESIAPKIDAIKKKVKLKSNGALRK